MEFGIFNWGVWHESRTQKDVIETVLRQGIQADELEFDSHWIGEHHFSQHGIVPNTQLMGGIIGARTERIRIGLPLSSIPSTTPCASPKTERSLTL